MFIRDVKEDDIIILQEMLRKEGIDKIGGILKVCVDETGGSEQVIGFFSYAIIRQVPFLWHFCIEKGHRTFKNAYFLIKEYRKQMRDMGYKNTVILLNKDHLCVRVEKYFKTKSLGLVNGNRVYCVEV